ncbi:MAG: hypothetical protein MI919_26625, partial [Holophagales bacterium]|nr:hypothetical protein [Holophagales bacterium]
EALGRLPGGAEEVIAPKVLDAWIGEPVGRELRRCREQELAERAARPEGTRPGRRTRELPMHVDHGSLKATGWALVLRDDVPAGVEEALGPLLEHRRNAAETVDAPERPIIVRWPRQAPLDTLREMLGSEKPGMLDTGRSPYYVLLAGGAESIPFEAQYELQIQHAVGRVAFDRPEDYRAYAEAVVAAETGGVRLPETLGLFSVEHEGDVATARLARDLVEPLAHSLDGASKLWRVERYGPERATRARLLELLGGADTPALLLVACHGFDGGGSEALRGALLCRDWPGGSHPPRPEHVVSAADLGEDADLHGQVVVMLACYGAGTPERDSYGEPGADLLAPEVFRRIATRPFVAELPQAMLRRGALAVLGHVDRGWDISVSWRHEGRVSAASRHFDDLFHCLLQDFRLGHAMRPLVRRYRELGARMAPMWEGAARYGDLHRETLGRFKLAFEDARRFVLLGDPAVRARGRFLSRPRRFRSG